MIGLRDVRNRMSQATFAVRWPIQFRLAELSVITMTAIAPASTKAFMFDIKRLSSADSITTITFKCPIRRVAGEVGYQKFICSAISFIAYDLARFSTM